MLNSSIGRKLIMALSGAFLIVFLTQHLIINLTSLIPDNGRVFNFISHFMGNNPIVQFVLQQLEVHRFVLAEFLCGTSAVPFATLVAHDVLHNFHRKKFERAQDLAHARKSWILAFWMRFVLCS